MNRVPQIFFVCKITLKHESLYAYTKVTYSFTESMNFRIAEVLRTLSKVAFYRWPLRPREVRGVSQLEVVSDGLEPKCSALQPNASSTVL